MGNSIDTIGSRIRTLRKKLGLTGAELGEIIGVGKQAISSYENGRVKVPIESMIKIATLGAISLDWLITGKGSGPGETKSFADVDPAPPTINEQQTTYTRAETRDESYLLRVYRQLSYDQQQAILDHADALSIAQESRRNVGGGSDLNAEKSA